MESVIDSIVQNYDLLNQKTVVIGDFDTGPIKSNPRKPIYGFDKSRGCKWINVWLSRNKLVWTHRNIKKNKMDEHGESMPDHIYISPNLTNCYKNPSYHHIEKDQWLSDHSIQTVELTATGY